MPYIIFSAFVCLVVYLGFELEWRRIKREQRRREARKNWNKTISSVQQMQITMSNLGTSMEHASIQMRKFSKTLRTADIYKE